MHENIPAWSYHIWAISKIPNTHYTHYKTQSIFFSMWTVYYFIKWKRRLDNKRKKRNKRHSTETQLTHTKTKYPSTLHTDHIVCFVFFCTVKRRWKSWSKQCNAKFVNHWNWRKIIFLWFFCIFWVTFEKIHYILKTYSKI